MSECLDPDHNPDADPGCTCGCCLETDPCSAFDAWKQDFNKHGGTGYKLVDIIHVDLMARKELGTAKYGPNFRGDPLQQAYEEALDLVWYLRTEIFRREQAR